MQQSLKAPNLGKTEKNNNNLKTNKKTKNPIANNSIQGRKLPKKIGGSYKEQELASKSAQKSKSVPPNSEAKNQHTPPCEEKKERDRSVGDDKVVEIKVTKNSTTELFPLKGHAGCVLYILKDIWDNKLLCDVTIKAGDKTFEAHRLVLSSCSGYFYERFCMKRTKSAILTINDVSSKIMERLLESMYTGYLKISKNNVMEVFEAATKLKYFTVEQACDGYLQTLVNVGNCFPYLEFANQQGFPGLREVGLKCIAENFEELASGTRYLSMDLNQVVSLLSRDDINASSELIVFDRMLDWINHDIPNRLGYGGVLLGQVRLPLMPASDIIDNVENTSYLMEVIECRQLVKEALHYHCLPARQSVLQNSRTRHRTKHQKEVVFYIGGAAKRMGATINKEITAYNSTKNEWDFVTSLPYPVHHHGVAVLGGFIYIVGGESENDQKSPVNKAYRFDPRTGSWLRIADMKRARQSFKLCVLMNMLYAIGGRLHQDKCLSEVERYNPTVDLWEHVSPLSSPRRAMAAAPHNGRIYVAGGTGDPCKFERYNPLSDSWEARQQLSKSRLFAELAVVHKYLYLLGGGTLDCAGNTSSITCVEVYCPMSDTWTKLKTRLRPRIEFGCAVLSNKIYLVGGFDEDTKEKLSTVEIFDTETENVERLRDIRVPLTGIACCATTICELKKGPRKQCTESTIDFYHHCSQSSCEIQMYESNRSTGTEEEKSKQGKNITTKPTTLKPNFPESKPIKHLCPQISKNPTIVRKKSPTSTAKKTGASSNYAQKYRLTRATSCEIEPTTRRNKGKSTVKLPSITQETKAKRM